MLDANVSERNRIRILNVGAHDRIKYLHLCAGSQASRHLLLFDANQDWLGSGDDSVDITQGILDAQDEEC